MSFHWALSTGLKQTESGEETPMKARGTKCQSTNSQQKMFWTDNLNISAY